MLLPLVAGCAIRGAVYEDTHRKVLVFEGTGAETFCTEGVDTPIVDVKPIGWGTHECERRAGD
jgi:hypothetical protein